MAIRVPNLGTGSGAVGDGDNELKIRQDYNHNFNDQSNAASRLVGAGADQIPLSSQVPSLLGTAATKNVGTATGNVMEVGAFGLGGGIKELVTLKGQNTSFYYAKGGSNYFGGGNFVLDVSYTGSVQAFRMSNTPYSYDFYLHHGIASGNNALSQGAKIYHDKNTTIVNGSIKPSSPVVKIHTDSLELNDDAERMGVTLNKRGVGDYLLQNTTGLRNDGGWRIELPQDVNGNPYFAVAYNELENNDIEVKTYKRIFDMNTFMFVPDLDNPVDIKEGRSIAIRFNDLPLDDIQTEV